jgi:hypothetical protein
MNKIHPEGSDSSNVDLECQIKQKEDSSCVKYTQLSYYWITFFAIWACIYYFGNTYAIEREKNCRENKEDIFVIAELKTLNGQHYAIYDNYTCPLKINIDHPQTNKTLIRIYVSKNHRKCSVEKDDEDCGAWIIIFNIILTSIGWIGPYFGAKLSMFVLFFFTEKTKKEMRTWRRFWCGKSET